ncbi:unnamed protein product, partial [Closterium sp. NIES-53]
LQQRGQLRLAYVASQANTADVFTKALQPCDHQPCFAFLDWSCDLLFSPTLPMGGRERYFLLVVDDYTWYTTVFPLRSKGQVPDVLIPWIRAIRLQLRERFRKYLPVLRLHSDRGDCVGRGRLAMRQFSGSGALVPLFAIRPRTSSPPVLFPASSLDFPLTRVAGSSTSLRRVIPSQDVTFDESVPFYRLFPYRSAPPPPPPFFLAPGPPPVDPLPPQGLGPSGVSQVDPLPGTSPVEVAVGSGAARGAASGGAAFGGAKPGVSE